MLEGGERSNAVAHKVSRHMDEAEDNGKGVVVFLRSLDVSKALNIIPNLPERQHGFDMGELLFREYRPDLATSKVALLERVMQETPTSNEVFGDWF